jgi:acyl-CoA synthetase (AMP-forming)/AMP-acid ligase II
MPDKYRSAYTAPEITDASSPINSTLDTYAVGMILYQIYNGGTLPSLDRDLEPPLYADYELAEIILKACDPDPQMRWQDPVQMGQALVAYVVLNDETLELRELLKFCAESSSLSSFTIPRYYRFVEELPYTATGKKQRFVLKRQAPEDLKAGLLNRN